MNKQIVTCIALTLAGMLYGSFTESNNLETYISTSSSDRDLYVKVFPSKEQEYAISSNGSRDVYVNFSDNWRNMTIWSHALAGSFSIGIYDVEGNVVEPVQRAGDGSRRAISEWAVDQVFRVHVHNNQPFNTRFRLVLDQEAYENTFDWMQPFYDDNFPGTGNAPAYEESGGTAGEQDDDGNGSEARSEGPTGVWSGTVRITDQGKTSSYQLVIDFDDLKASNGGNTYSGKVSVDPDNQRITVDWRQSGLEGVEYSTDGNSLSAHGSIKAYSDGRQLTTSWDISRQ